MKSVLAIICIIFFCYLTHIIIKGVNENRDHKYSCKTLFIPEYMDVESAFESIKGLNRSELKRDLGNLEHQKNLLIKQTI